MAEFRTTTGGVIEVFQRGVWTAIPFEAANELQRLEAGLKDVLRASLIGDAAEAVKEMRKVASKALCP